MLRISAWCQFIFTMLIFWKTNDMKRGETTVESEIFFLQYYKNYSKLSFYFCLMQRDRALKVAAIERSLLSGKKCWNFPFFLPAFFQTTFWNQPISGKSFKLRHSYHALIKIYLNRGKSFGKLSNKRLKFSSWNKSLTNYDCHNVQRFVLTLIDLRFD